MAAMETSQEDECYKVSTRSRDKHEKKKDKHEKRKEKHEINEEKKARKEKEKEEALRVPTDQDSDYRRDHPKLFYPKVNANVKKQLEEMKTLEAQASLKKDLEMAKRLKEQDEAQAEVVSQPVVSKPVVSQPMVEQPVVEKPYDIKGDVRDCLVTATMGQLLKDNPMYRRQLREMLIGRRKRKLPKVGDSIDVMMVAEDQGAYEIAIQILGCVLSCVLVDGGSRVNIMIEATAHQLGFKEFEPTARTMRLILI
ncbi:unnamed protein product [Calypogeia fissa]